MPQTKESDGEVTLEGADAVVDVAAGEAVEATMEINAVMVMDLLRTAISPLRKGQIRRRDDYQSLH